MDNNYKPLLEENSVAAYYDLEDNWFYISWYGEQTQQSRMRVFDEVLEYFNRANCTKILNDNTHNTSLWSDCSLWLLNDWLPRAEASGLRSLAWVYSKDPEVRRSAEEMISRLSGRSIVIAFDKLEDAKAWLNSV
ncbi:MAG TPA: hypothetical protein VK927_06590 [Adhaeribacter sp.]|nr:hypothetical protein [Adhaeribacter sp.]